MSRFFRYNKVYKNVICFIIIIKSKITRDFQVSERKKKKNHDFRRSGVVFVFSPKEINSVF